MTSTDGIMSRHELVLTTAWAGGIACVVVAALCAWLVLTDPATLVSATGGQDAASFASFALHLVVNAVSALLSLDGW